MPVMKKDYSYFLVRLHLLDKYLQEKIDAGESLRLGLVINGKRNVKEIDLRMDAVLKGFRKASLSSAERADLTKRKLDIYNRFG